MQLVAPLTSGVRGAENGTAFFYKRGTSTFAGYYDSFEADGTLNATGSIALDSNGGAVVYVNELVTVIAKDSDGNTVREFVAGENASAVEVISQAFTGTDYETAQSGANKPTTLEAILDLWKTSSGTIDWNVLLGGVKTSLQNAFLTSPLWYNVKAYGAKGDNVTDDTVAIQAAITAASAPVAGGGGIVYFPVGSYKITDELSVSGSQGVSFLGTGNQSLINQTSVGKKTLKGFGATIPQFIQDLYFFVTGNVTADTISIESISDVTVQRCRFKTYSGTAIKVAAAGTDGTRLIVRDSRFTLGTTPSSAAQMLNNVNTSFSFNDNWVDLAANYAGASDACVIAPYGLVSGCHFDFANLKATTGTVITGVRMSDPGTGFGGQTLKVIGNDFSKYPGSGVVGTDWTVYAMEDSSRYRVTEFGNNTAGPIGAFKIETLAGATLGYHSMRERDGSITANSAAATASLDLASGSFTYGHPGLIAWGTSVVTTFSAGARSPGSRQILLIKNTDVGAHTPLFGAGIQTLAGAANIAAGNSSIYELIAILKPDGSISNILVPLKENVTI